MKAPKEKPYLNFHHLFTYQQLEYFIAELLRRVLICAYTVANQELADGLVQVRGGVQVLRVFSNGTYKVVQLEHED
jgi:hypothetical protein